MWYSRVFHAWMYVAVAALLAMLLLPPLAASSQEPQLPPTLTRLNVSIVAKNVTYELRVYPDGSVQPITTLYMIVKGVEAEGVTLSYKSATTATKSLYESRTRLEALIPAATILHYFLHYFSKYSRLEAAGLNKTIEFKAETEMLYTLGPGFESKGQAHVTISNKTSSVVIKTLYVFSIDGKGGYSLTLDTSFEGVKPGLVDRIEELFRKALGEITNETAGLVSKWIVTRVNEREIRVHVKGSIASLAAGLLALGVSPTDVSQLLSLLKKNYGIKGKYVMRLEAEYTPVNGFKTTMESESRAQGKIEEYYIDAARASNAIAKIVTALLVSILRQQGYNIPLAAASLASQEPLAKKPPFEAQTEVYVKGERGYLEVRVHYVGPKMVYAYPTGISSTDAAKTLSILAKQLAQEYATLKILSLVIPGIDTLVPRVIVVKGVDGVRVTPSTVPVDELENTVFHVTVVKTQSPTGTATARQTTTGTRTEAAMPRATGTAGTTRGLVASSSPISTSTTPVHSLPQPATGGGLTTTIIAAVIAALAGAGVAYALASRR